MKELTVNNLEHTFNAMIRNDAETHDAIKETLTRLLLTNASVQDAVVEAMKQSIKREKEYGQDLR